MRLQITWMENGEIATFEGPLFTDMTEVLECFRGGDAVKLDRIGRILERAFHDPTALLGYTREDRLDMLDCIKRHQKAAFLMEGQ